jgi:hypothetical protein
MVCLHGLMGIDMKVVIKMILSIVMEHFIGLMADNMQVCGRMDYNMVKVLIQAKIQTSNQEQANGGMVMSLSGLKTDT